LQQILMIYVRGAKWRHNGHVQYCHFKVLRW